MKLPSLKMAFLSIFGVAAQLGLAILGGGGFAVFFSNPALAALVWITAGLTVAALFTGGNLSSGKREDRANRWVLWAFGAIGLLVAFFPAYTDRIGFWTIDGDKTRWIGIVVFTIGGVIRLWPVAVLGHRFSGLVAIQQNHRLVTTGIYGVVRHPSYLGLVLGTLGWALTFRSGIGIILAALTLVPLIARIHAEEALLRDTFGEEYEKYRQQTTAKLVPGIF